MTFRKTVFSLTVLAMVAFISACVQMGFDGRTTVSSQKFAKRVYMTSQFEAAASNIAVTKARSSKVRHFAKLMIEDYADVQRKLLITVDDANLKDVTFPEGLDSQHKAMLDRLKKASKHDFDQQYMAMQKQIHGHAVALYQRYAREGQNTVLKEFAQNFLPMMQKHDKFARKLKV